jgi:hypothetical protein
MTFLFIECHGSTFAIFPDGMFVLATASLEMMIIEVQQTHFIP